MAAHLEFDAPTLAEAAAAQGVHYLDLTEDVASTRRVKELALTAKAALIPQCGLAPGFISIVAADLARDLTGERVDPGAQDVADDEQQQQPGSHDPSQLWFVVGFRL